MPNRAAEHQIQAKLVADTVLMGAVANVYVSKVPRAAKLPYVVISLINDNNSKNLLSRWGGGAELQFDIFSRSDSDYVLRAVLKDALRRIKGSAGGLNIAAVRVNGENDFGMEGDTGLHRWVITAQVYYFEEE